MTIAIEFDYHKPNDVREALKLLADYSGKAMVLAGGTDIVNLLRKEIISPAALVDIKGINELKKIELNDDKLHIGALTTFSEIIESDLIKEKFPLLKEMAEQVASVGVRNRATMVGNICFAVPSCDSGSVLLTYEAEVLINGPQGERKCPIGEWFKGPKQTALQEGEIVVGLVIPLPAKKHFGCYLKLGRYQGEDLAQAGVSIIAFPDEVRVGFGAVAAKPMRADKIEKLFAGKSITEDLVKEAVKLVASIISPITDIRATKEYRLKMVELMLARGLKKAQLQIQS